MRHLLMIFVKFPEPGKVKTRLAKVLGDEGAAKAYRQLVSHVAEGVQPPQGLEDQWAIWVVFDPAERESEVREWLDPQFRGAASRYLAQVPGDLGDRLVGAFAAGFEAGFGKIAAIGTDCVDLDADGIGEAWKMLDQRDVVFGPADDGGYYLVGLKDASPIIFQGVPWSDPRTLAVSRQIASEAGLSVGELAVLSDIDEIEQWRELSARPGWTDLD